jgi:hypothetical protein
MDALIEAALAAGQSDDVSVVVNTLRESGLQGKRDGIETIRQSSPLADEGVGRGGKNGGESVDRR